MKAFMMVTPRPPSGHGPIRPLARTCRGYRGAAHRWRLWPQGTRSSDPERPSTGRRSGTAGWRFVDRTRRRAAVDPDDQDGSAFLDLEVALEGFDLSALGRRRLMQIV